MISPSIVKQEFDMVNLTDLHGSKAQMGDNSYTQEQEDLAKR